MGFVPATVEHARYVARHLREGDRLELDALAMEAEPQAVASLNASVAASTWLVRGEPAVICGVALEAGPLLGPRCAQVWALTTPAVDTRRRAFWVDSRRWIHDAHQHAELLFQHVDARYVSCLRWLVRLGFHVAPAKPFGPLGVPFHLAVKEL